MKRYSWIFKTWATAIVLIPILTGVMYAQGDSAFKALSPRVKTSGLLSQWQVDDPRLAKLIFQYASSTLGKTPSGLKDKITVWGEPKLNSTNLAKSFELYQLEIGSIIVPEKDLYEMQLQNPGFYKIIAEVVGPEGEELYEHKWLIQSSQSAGSTNPLRDKRFGAGENNFRMPVGGRQYYSLSAFDQMLRVGATNWWIHNTIGNDNAGYMFWHAGESKISVLRSLIDNDEANTSRRVVPQLLKLSAGVVYRINDEVANPDARFTDFLRRRSLNMGPDPKIAFSVEGVLPIDPQESKTSVFGARINAEIPVQRINESVQIAEPLSFARFAFNETNGIIRGEQQLRLTSRHPQYSPTDNRFILNASGGVPLISPILRTVAQATLFYTWWLDDGSGNTPDNIFRIDAGINYTEVIETALVSPQPNNPDEKTRPTYFATSNSVEPLNRGGRGLLNYTPQSVLDWVFFKFDYRNETTFPFGITLQYSNQIFMATGYIPIFGNWLYLEAKYARVMRELRPYESENYFMISPVLRIWIPR